ncbi:MAG: FAD-dependent oxidoreductase [Chloroflexota bacterium]
MYDIVILGGGPAAITAAVYIGRKRLNALLLTKNIGGQVLETMSVENYLGYSFIEGPELIQKFDTQLREHPIDIKLGYRVTKVRQADEHFEVDTESGESFLSKVVLYTLGKRARRLGVPGEDRLVGRGVSYCAVCDGPLFAGQKVTIVGGGDSALEAAYDLIKMAEHVYLVSLTPFTADPVLVERVVGAPNLTTFVEHIAEEIEGGEFVEAIRIRDLKTGERKRLESKAVFVEIGLIPNSEPLKGLVTLNKWGEVPVNTCCETEIPGLYAAGDVTDIPEKQIIVACGEGAKAALQASKYLQKNK